MEDLLCRRCALKVAETILAETEITKRTTKETSGQSPKAP